MDIIIIYSTICVQDSGVELTPITNHCLLVTTEDKDLGKYITSDTKQSLRCLKSASKDISLGNGQKKFQAFGYGRFQDNCKTTLGVHGGEKFL